MENVLDSANVSIRLASGSCFTDDVPSDMLAVLLHQGRHRISCVLRIHYLSDMRRRRYRDCGGEKLGIRTAIHGALCSRLSLPAYFCHLWSRLPSTISQIDRCKNVDWLQEGAYNGLGSSTSIRAHGVF